MSKRNGARAAFTITEMLVSLAVIMFIMAIISEAFVAGLDSFRQLKAVGDLDQRLRAATILIRNDLLADHLNNPPTQVSTITLTPPPAEGYFYIQGGASASEGSDADGILSPKGSGHWLAFTVNWSKASGTKDDPHLKRIENYLSAYVAGTPLAGLSPAQFNDGQNYLSQSAEVAYFLTPTGGTTTGNAPQTLYRLHRRQRLLLPASDATNMNAQNIPAAQLASYESVAVRDEGGTLHFHTLKDVSDPAERTLVPPSPLTGTAAGTDIILSDVVSFTIRVMPTGTNDFVDVPGNTYDTGAATSTIQAIEITLRVWDVKTSTTRQITIVQDL